MLEERLLNLGMREADVAIRLQPPTQADLIQRKLLNVRAKFFATRSYIKEKGLPNNIDELSNKHRLICHAPYTSQPTAIQRFIAPFLARKDFSLLLLNNYYGIFRAVRNGLGVGTLPDYIATDFPELIQVLPELQSEVVPIFIAYPQEIKRSKRLIAFKDFILDELKANKKT